MGSFHYIGTAVLIAKGLHALEEAVKDGLEELKETAIPLTPMLSGGLRGDYGIDGPHTSTSSVEGSVRTGQTGEGGPAAIVHERTELHHPVGRSKFLETAVHDEARRLRGKVAVAAKRAYR